MSRVNGNRLLDVQGLTVAYRGGRSLALRRPLIHAVRDVGFSVGRGETLGLVGESGSGKSTTARAILGLVEVAAGRIMFDGFDVTAAGRKLPLSYRRSVQAVFQDPASSLNPRRIVSEAVMEPLRRHAIGDSAKRRSGVAEAFERVGLSRSHLGRYPAELSGGQQQRVAIARALALSPRLVICDEAVSSLDVSTQSQIINLLEDLQDSLGISYVFIAHDLAVVRHISHRVAVMRAGTIVETAATEALFAGPRHPYTQALLDAIPRLSKRHSARRAATTDPMNGEPNRAQGHARRSEKGVRP
jgi:peptide/nickel transport system ATP-binding protein